LIFQYNDDSLRLPDVLRSVVYVSNKSRVAV